MDTDEQQDLNLEIRQRLQAVIEACHKDFQTAVAHSSDVLRQAITSAQESISIQLQSVTQLHAEGLPRDAAKAPDPLATVNSGVVEDLFEQTQAILNRLELDSNAALAEALRPRTLIPPPPVVALEPQAAAAHLVGQGTQSLNAAIQALLDSMNRAQIVSETDKT